MDREVSVLFTARDATSQAFASIKKSLGSVGQAFENIERKFRSVGRGMRDIGAGLSLSVTAPLVLFGKSAIDAASEAMEMQSAFEQTFKGSSAAIRAWSEQTAPAINRSATELQSGALRFGQLFTQVTDTVKASGLSQEFALLAQDAASFFNTDVGTAVDKLRSGLSGEAEPLRDFGVFLSDAAVKAQALKMGLGGLKGELTEQEKVLVRAQVILQQMSAAQGDAARTSGSYENTVRGMSSAFEDLKRTIGVELLPMATQVVQAITGMIRWFSGLPEPIRRATVIFAALAAVIGPLVVTLGLMAMAIGAIGVPISAVVLGITALTAAAVAFWPEIQRAWEWVQKLAAAFVALHVQGIAILITKFQELRTSISTALSGVSDEVVRIFTGLAEAMVTIGGQIIEGLWQGIKAKWEFVKGEISGIAAGIKDRFTSFFDIHSPSRVMHEIGTNLMQGLGNGLAGSKAAVLQTAGDISADIKDNFSSMDQLGQSLQGTFGNFFQGIIKGGDEAKSAIKSLVSELGNMALQQGMQALGKAFPSFSNLLGGLFTPRAKGGSVTPGGGPYMTGEEGVEIFQPGRSGRIINHDDVKEIAGGKYAGRMRDAASSGGSYRGGDVIVQGDVSEKNMALIKRAIDDNNRKLAYARSNEWRT